jgi:hypothetical protein
MKTKTKEPLMVSDMIILEETILIPPHWFSFKHHFLHLKKMN